MFKGPIFLIIFRRDPLKFIAIIGLCNKESSESNSIYVFRFSHTTIITGLPSTRRKRFPTWNIKTSSPGIEDTTFILAIFSAELFLCMWAVPQGVHDLVLVEPNSDWLTLVSASTAVSCLPQAIGRDACGVFKDTHVRTCYS